MDDHNRRFARAARSEHDHLDNIFTSQEERRVTAQLTVHHKRTMYLLEPMAQAEATTKKRATDSLPGCRLRGLEPGAPLNGTDAISSHLPLARQGRSP
jgi:hypothetical protein